MLIQLASSWTRAIFGWCTEYVLVSIRYDTYLSMRANDMDPNKPQEPSQLSLFSLSTKAKAQGTNALSASHEMATKSVPMYLPSRKVPSMDNTGR